MYQLVQHPEAPFTTLAGDTKGPCVHIGFDQAGRVLYVGEPELRQMLKAFKWPAPETHERAVTELLAAEARAVDAERERDEAIAHAQALAETIRIVTLTEAEEATV